MFLFHTPFTTVVLFLKLYEVCEYLPMPIPETPVNVLGGNGNWLLADLYLQSALSV